MFGRLPSFAQVMIPQEDPSRVLQAMPWYAWVAIVAILVGGINGFLATLIRHRERMAMIRHGMHPDAVTPADPHTKPVCQEASEF